MFSDGSLFIGPTIPNHLFTNEESEETKINLPENIGNSATVGQIGPLLPPHMVPNESLACIEMEDSRVSGVATGFVSKEAALDEVDLYGPALPPHLKKQNMTLSVSSLQSSGDPRKKDTLNVHSNYSNSEDEDVIGPIPEGSSQQMSMNQQQLEIRANYLKRKMAEEATPDKKETKRETWMLELPPDKAQNIGLGPRSFRKREGPDMSDRSDWTDTPADRARKLLVQDNVSNVNIKEEMNSAAIKERDKVMEHMVEKCKDKKRELSLLDMHQKKLKKKKKEKKNEKPERRPFDRNIDLQANRFDEAQKKSIFKKAQLLNTRFSQGQSKYL